jgi:phosphate starvation-inducible PhoH-like protein
VSSIAPSSDASSPPGQDQTQEKLSIGDNELALAVFGESGSHLTLLERRLGIDAHARGSELRLHGADPAVQLGRRVVEELITLAKRNVALSTDEVGRAVDVLRQDPDVHLADIFCDTVMVSARARPITPRGLAQKRYVEALRKRDLVFAIGPAGTGKTYLAVAMAVLAHQEQRVRRIVLTRPAVEAGERLGFLPGTMEEKVNPYVRPLYDALNDLLSFEKTATLIERGIIEIAPLAFMRGRTLNDSFVILDEAQNTTSEQMKMFLTRLGYDSQAVVTGDITQVDLPNGAVSGLVEARDILRGVKGIEICHFTEVDVVRHPLVQKIIRAYDRYERRTQSGARGGPAIDHWADDGIAPRGDTGISGGSEAANGEEPGAEHGGEPGADDEDRQ